MKITAIDFETANSLRDSICSVGISVIEDGQEIEHFYSLVKPSPYKISDVNYRSHGLGYDILNDAEPFESVFEKFKKYLTGIVVSHNANFDMDCLSTALYNKKIEFPDFKFICTKELSELLNNILNICDNCHLDTLCAHFGIELREHHNALEDARACGKLFFRLKTFIQEEDISNFYKNFRDRISIEERQQYDYFWQRASISDVKQTKKDLPFSEPETVNIENSTFIVTGMFESMPRKDIENFIKSHGGKIQSSPSKKTNYIVIGNLQNDKWKNGNYGRKIEEALKHENIIFIKENYFVNKVIQK